MFQGAQREAGNLRALLQFIRELMSADSPEDVYAAALDIVQEMFAPDRGFIALSEFVSTASNVDAPRPGFLSDVIVPIHAGDKLAGRIILQYERPRLFSDQDLAIIEIIAAQSGFVLDCIYERNTAREAQHQKDELVAMAAHELRSPLTAILGGTFLLRARREDERVRAVEMIERNARVQLTLIEELLHACQIDAGKVELQIETLDLVSVLERVTDEIQATAEGNNTTVSAELERPIMIRGDAQRLWQIFSNLVSNSVRFASPNGKVRITGRSNSTGATICVQDDGIGISQDQLPYIFERFRQAHIPRLKSDGGLGLGLAIVKDLVTLHGGAITATSDGLGKGACFTVKLHV